MRLHEQFLLTARRTDAKSVKIKKTGQTTKFKVLHDTRLSTGLISWCNSNHRRQQSRLPLQVRCSRLLYTLCVDDNDKADKLKQSLPPGALSVPTLQRLCLWLVQIQEGS